MKKFIIYPALLLALAVTALTSCKKDSATADNSTTKTASTIDATTTISLGLVAATTTANTVTKDSLYLVNCKGKHDKKQPVAAADLSSAITTYLTTNYSGYTFDRAFKVSDSTGVVINYIVVIKYNNAFVGLKFKADGTFVSVLEQMLGGDMRGPGPGPGPGFHPGGPFENRGGIRNDTIAISALPAAIKTAFTTAYPKDTLLHAAITPDSTYLLLSKNAGLYATAISKTGTVLKHDLLPKPGNGRGKPTEVAQASLPAAIGNYLTATYPGYVFDKAFSISDNGTLQGYDVLITVNNTHYGVSFNASGTFVRAVTLH